MPVFHLMPCVLSKFPCWVIVDDVINGLVGHLYPLIHAQIPWYLSWRPLVIGNIFFILQTNSSESLALVTVFFLRRCIAISCAFVQIYFPEGVLLRLISRESVDWLIPTMSAISFLAVFFWSKAKICDLCSEINWWYICNTKLVNLWETSVSFFYLYCWLFLFPLREMQTTSRYASRTSASLGEGHSFIALRFGTCKRTYTLF